MPREKALSATRTAQAWHTERVRAQAAAELQSTITQQELNETLTPTVDPSDVGSTSAGSTETGFALADHVHRHGLQDPSQFMHPPVDATNDGFMSVADKAILDALAVGPTAHAVSHQAGGADELTLDSLGDPVASVEFAQQQALQFVLENRTSNPGSPVVGQMIIRTDLI